MGCETRRKFLTCGQSIPIQRDMGRKHCFSMKSDKSYCVLCLTVVVRLPPAGSAQAVSLEHVCLRGPHTESQWGLEEPVLKQCSRSGNRLISV